MKLIKRRHGSQRAMTPVAINTEINYGGQGGKPYITFFGEDGIHYTIVPESDEDCRELQSQAAICRLNFGEER